MRIFCRRWAFFLLVAFLVSFCSCAACAQTLARRGWVGSGLNAEPWWRSAVFYRIAPESFQDSDGDSLGDLRGIAQRMDYLQSLGVDALVLETPFADSGFDDLLDEAGRHHIRLLVELPSTDGSAATSVARQWLTRGAAGIWLRVARREPAEHMVALVHSLRTLMDSFPGQRVLVEDTTADPAVWPTAGAELVARAIPAGAVSNGDAVALRLGLAQAQNVPQGSVPLWLALAGGARAMDTADPHTPEKQKIVAAVLLASHAAVALEYGQEIGLASMPANEGRIMRWTPSNVTAPVEAPPGQAAPAPTPQPREDVYGAYVPYVPPQEPEKPAGPGKPNFDALPGFTSGRLTQRVDADSSSATNVASEDADPASLLNFYRRLVQLHHGNPAMHSGTGSALGHDAEGAVIWTLRAPANARTGSTVVAACNLTGQRVVVPLRGDFARLKLRGGDLRLLLTSAKSNAQVDETTDALVLAPWSVFLGELYR